MEDRTTRKTEEYQEMDLCDVIKILLKRKWLIAGVTLAFGLAAFTLSTAMPKVYQVSASLQVGTVVRNGEEKVIESADQVKEKNDNDVYGVLIRQKLGLKQDGYPAITAQIGPKTAIISFSTRSSDVDLAKKILQEINGVIISDHQKIYDSVKKEVEDKIKIEKSDKERLIAKIKLLETEQTTIGSRVAYLQKMAAGNFDTENEMAILNAEDRLEAIKGRIEDSYFAINEAERKIANYQANLEIMQPTKAIKEPCSSANPVAFDAKISTLLAIVLGFFFAIFFAFAAEWWDKPKTDYTAAQGE